MTAIHNRLELYIYSSDTYAEVYAVANNIGATFVIDFANPQAEDIIAFLVDGQDTARGIVSGNSIGYELRIASVYNYYNIAEAMADGADPHDEMPFTVSMSFFAHEHKDFGDFLDALNFNHEHLDAVCADAVLKTY